MLRVLVLVAQTKGVVEGELGLDHLFLEVAWELCAHSVGVRVALVDLDVAMVYVQLMGCLCDADLQLVDVVHKVGHHVVISPPVGLDLLSLIEAEVFVLADMHAVNDLLELSLQLGCHL